MVKRKHEVESGNNNSFVKVLYHEISFIDSKVLYYARIFVLNWRKSLRRGYKFLVLLDNYKLIFI